MPELDSVRGIAILMVVIFHAFIWREVWGLVPLPHVTMLLINVTRIGRLGVNLFFVLSGFLITGLLLDSVTRPDYFRRFYTRRVARILPAFYLTLLVLTITHHAPGPFLGFSAVFLANISPLFGVATGYVVLWSLAVEEHFYLVWPAIVRHLTPRGLLRLCVAVLLLDPVLRAISYVLSLPHGTDWNDVTRYTWNAVDAVALGCAFAVALRQFHWTRRDTFRYALIDVGCGVVFFCAALPFGIATRHASVIGAALQEVPWNLAFAGFLALFMVVGTGRWKRLVSPAPLVFLGRISYGLYLIHFFILDEYDAITFRYLPHLVPLAGQLSLLCLRFAAAASAATLFAALSRETLEEFFLNLASRGARGSMHAIDMVPQHSHQFWRSSPP